MVFQGEDKFQLSGGVKVTLGIVIGIAVVVAVLMATGAWDYILYEWLYAGDSSAIVTNAIFLIIVVAVIAVMVWPVKKS